MRYAIASAAVVLAFAAPPAFAQTQTSDRPTTKAASKVSDEAFVKNAAAGNLAEVELGKLATEKASNPDVKKFGQKMVDDHTKANDELKGPASKINTPIPTTLTGAHKATYDRLSKLSGPAFDHAYIEDMVKDHRADIAEFKTEATAGQNPDVKAFAANTLPTLEDHLRMAESLEKPTGTTGTVR